MYLLQYMAIIWSFLLSYIVKHIFIYLDQIHNNQMLNYIYTNGSVDVAYDKLSYTDFESTAATHFRPIYRVTLVFDISLVHPSYNTHHNLLPSALYIYKSIIDYNYRGLKYLTSFQSFQTLPSLRNNLFIHFSFYSVPIFNITLVNKLLSISLSIPHQ